MNPKVPESRVSCSKTIQTIEIAATTVTIKQTNSGGPEILGVAVGAARGSRRHAQRGVVALVGRSRTTISASSFD